ncbi:MAG: DNA polymerase [Candidatus Heimdallarchaeota archaeon LC_3]|nr:MAG: DNA polymerase [Candidatus Heimdallarchaeota archaeon LC_3]
MSSTNLYLNLIDLDYYMTNNNQKINIRFFTKDINNQSIILVINDYFPYFYVGFSNEIEDIIRKNCDLKNWLISKEILEKKLYFGGKKVKVIKLIGKIPFLVPKLAKIILKNSLKVYEADIPFVKRFVIDRNIYSLHPIRITLKNEQLIELKNNKILTLSYNDLKSVNSDSLENKFHLTYFAFDIEVAAEEESVQQLFEKSEKRIIAISVCYGNYVTDHKTEAEILQNESDLGEKRLISWFLEKISSINPDVIITFNGDLFDFPYIIKRMDHLNIATHLFGVTKNPQDNIYYQQGTKSFRIKGRISVDLFYKTWGLHPTSGKKTLKNIAEMKLGLSKEERPENFYKIWHEGVIEGISVSYNLLFKYSKRDAELTFLLFEPLEQLAQVDAVKLVGMPSADGIATTARNIGEFELFRVCYKKNILIPMLPTSDEVKAREQAKRISPHRGGLVLEPPGSFFSSVGIFDFRSMYPSIISAFNIGGESYHPPKNNPDLPVEKHFLSTPRTSLAEMMSNILSERVKYKLAYQKAKKEGNLSLSDIDVLKRRSTSFKLVMNSTFGSHNYPRGRFFSKNVSDSITEIGRSYIRWLEDEVKIYNSNYEVIYGDTDSAFVWFKNNSIQEITKGYELNDEKNKEIAFFKVNNLVNYLNSKLKKPMELEVEDIAYRMAFKTGRRKAYSYANMSGELFIKGFEAVRADWSILAREVQTKVLHTLLTIPKGGEDEAKKVLMNYVKKLHSLSHFELIKEVVIYSPIKRPPSKYRTAIPVVGAFLHFCKQNKFDPEKNWKEYDKFPWVIIPGKGNLSNRARHPKFVSQIDRIHYTDEIVRAAERFGVNLSFRRTNKSTLLKYIDQVTQEDLKNVNSSKLLFSKPSKKENNWIKKFIHEKN